jgi:predicted ArsR family transcriptional regulator
MMKPTRTRILEYLQNKRTATPIEMALALHLTPANIRHHIAILEVEGALTIVGKRRETPYGRSSRIFALRAESLNHNLGVLASALLDEGQAAQMESDQYYQRVAVRIASQLDQTPIAASKRLVHTVNRLNEMNYQARWEARLDAPRVILGHCPYAALLPDHPEICQIDSHLLEKMLGSQVRKTAHLEPTPQGLKQCVFAVEQAINRK